MSDTHLALASEFDAASDEKWRELVVKTLKGKDFDRAMTASTYDDIPVHGLYTQATAKIKAQSPTRNGAWDICAAHWDTDPKSMNAAILTDLEKGATSIAVRFTNAHFPGVSVSDMDTIFDGVYLNLAPVGLSAGEEFDAVGRAYLALLDTRDYKAEEIKGCLGADPIGALAFSGRLKDKAEDAIEAAVALALETNSKYSNLTTFVVDGSIYHGAGATEAMELAAILSTGVHYLRAMETAGISLETAARSIQVSIAADADIYLTVAKIRAVRRLWANALAACGIRDVSCTVNAISGVRMFTSKDPWVNILRTTAASFAAGVAGADSICVLPHDILLGMPNEFSRRIARNVQIILQEESSLSKVVDPAAGSYAFETLTTELTEKGWDYFQKLESEGGILTCLRSNLIQKGLDDAWAKRAINLAKRKDPVTGVSEFPDIHEKPIDGLAPAAPFVVEAPEAKENITPIPMHRLAEDFEELRFRSDVVLESTTKRPSIQLINLGPVAAHTARATFAKNIFEAGGIETLACEPIENIDAAKSVFAASAASVAVICGSDSLYDEMGLAVAEALKSVGCNRIYLAGKPVETEKFQTAGVYEFIFMGANVLATLRNLMDLLTNNAGDAS